MQSIPSLQSQRSPAPSGPPCADPVLLEVRLRLLPGEQRVVLRLLNLRAGLPPSSRSHPPTSKPHHDSVHGGGAFNADAEHTQKDIAAHG